MIIQDMQAGLDIFLPGDKIFVTGPSGSGKTLMFQKLKLLARVNKTYSSMRFISHDTPPEIYDAIFSMNDTQLLVIDEYDILYLLDNRIADYVNNCKFPVMVIGRNFANLSRRGCIYMTVQIDSKKTISLSCR